MLHEAFKNNETDWAIELLQQEVNALKEDKDGWTPLSWAAFYGNEKLVKVLLKEH